MAQKRINFANFDIFDGIVVKMIWNEEKVSE